MFSFNSYKEAVWGRNIFMQDSFPPFKLRLLFNIVSMLKLFNIVLFSIVPGLLMAQKGNEKVQSVKIQSTIK
jgi:hypothetical protein